MPNQWKFNVKIKQCNCTTNIVKLNGTLLGGMPIKFIGNSFVTFYTKHLPLEFIGNYNVCEIPLKSIGKSFNIQSNYYLRRIFPKRITGESF